MFTFGCEFDDFLALQHLRDRDSLLKGGSFCFERDYTITGDTDLLTELPQSDLVSTPRLPVCLAVIDSGCTKGFLQLCQSGSGKFHLPICFLPSGVGDGSCRVVRFDLIVNQRVDKVFFAEVLKEVFLTPAFEHPVGDDDVPIDLSINNAMIMAKQREALIDGCNHEAFAETLPAA